MHFHFSTVNVSTFPQEFLEQGLSFLTIKIYLAIIFASLGSFEMVVPMAHTLATHFV